MKRLIALTLIIFSLALTALHAAGPDGEIKWETTSHDFGTIKASDGKVTAHYSFVNATGAPVAIIAMTNGGCGCTEPSFPRKPIAAGEKGTVTITFDPARFKGEFKRQVTVTIMDGSKKSKTRLKFSGHIIPN
ncbi:MAG: DUF1573 domain-containing protein [Pseudoflavonifractor sp.]|nr:DUF1573 domain-containing protein [Alloprevotella sp.]MCM1116308.1 DUF1573 domain-containing protein [Pseudoflavonifractor sp.]